MEFVAAIREFWGWTGIDPVEVVGESDFGNLIIEDRQGAYWRLRPEQCVCEMVARDRAALDLLSRDQEFLRGWYLTDLVKLAKDHFGPLTDGRKYCLKLPAVLGGGYGAENLATAPLVEIVSMSGDIARQIQDVPDGAQVCIEVVK